MPLLSDGTSDGVTRQDALRDPLYLVSVLFELIVQDVRKPQINWTCAHFWMAESTEVNADAVLADYLH
jgi:hypothetical protein